MFKPQPTNPEYVKRAARAQEVLKSYCITSGRDANGKRIVLLASPAGEQYRCSSDHTCTCTDFQVRGQAQGIPCKHLLAAYDWLRAQKAGHPVPAPVAAPYNSPAVPDRERVDQLRAELFGEPEPVSIMSPAPSGEQAPAADPAAQGLQAQAKSKTARAELNRKLDAASRTDEIRARRADDFPEN